MFTLTLFRRTDKLGVLQESFFPPTDYRLLDAINLRNYINCENELKREEDTSDYFDNELNSSNTYYSFSQPFLTRCTRRLRVKIRSKPRILVI